MIDTKRELELIEYQTKYLRQEDFSDELGEFIWKNYNAQVSIDFPSVKTNRQWCLTNQGWIGYIPVNEKLLLSLKPKISIENVFRMLEYALKDLQIVSEQLAYCNSLQDF